MKKRLVCLLLAVMLLLVGCGTAEEPRPTMGVVDDCPRGVKMYADTSKIAVTGPLTQIYVLPLAGDMLVGVSNAFSDDAAKYLPAYLFEKTEIGQLYGGKGEMDLEALLSAAPDVVIDIGEPKESLAEDMDALSEQTGIPFFHINATVQTAPDAYRKLGSILNREEQAEELAQWLESTYAMMEELMARVDADNARKSVLYCLGDKGTNVIAQGSFHAETINMMADNVAVVEDVVSKGTGNEVDLEQILLWDPDVLLFAPDSCYEEIAGSEQWQNVSAVAAGRYYETPEGPYGWLSSPPAVQRYLGMLWLGELLYPEYTEYDLQEEITEYYRLFYGCGLTDEMYQELVRNALE